MPLEMTQRAETTPNVSLRPKTLFAAICSTTVLHSCPGVAPPSFQRDVNLKAETCELAICVHNRTVGGATCELLQADSINLSRVKSRFVRRNSPSCARWLKGRRHSEFCDY